jgi:glycosyltransferase involved in cell wall biosynthesis
VTNVLVEYEKLNPSFLLVKEIFDAFASKYDTKFRYLRSSIISSHDIAWSDIVISIRGFVNLSLDICLEAKRNGRKHILFIDDDLLNLPKDYRVLADRKRALRGILDQTDLIMAVNPILGKKYGNLTKSRKYTLINVIEGSFIRPRPEKKCGGKTKIVYAANKGHVKIFDRYILPLLPALCKEFKDKITMTFIGVKPNLSIFENEIEIRYLPTMAFEKYRQYMQDNKFDIGLAPINNDEFSNCKYYNKFIEYTLAGVMGIYTKCPPYSLIIEDRVNGILCENTVEDWLNAFKEAINNLEMRKFCVMNAQRLLRENFSKEKVLRSIAIQIPDLIQYKAKVVRNKRIWGLKKIKYVFFQLKENLFFTLIHLVEDGLIITCKKAYQHIVDTKEYNKGNVKKEERM